MIMFKVPIQAHEDGYNVGHLNCYDLSIAVAAGAFRSEFYEWFCLTGIMQRHKGKTVY